MRNDSALIACLLSLGAVTFTSSDAHCASWEVGTSYILDIGSGHLDKWEYFGQRISFGIVESVIPTMQLGGYASYGRYRQKECNQELLWAPVTSNLSSCRSQGAVSTETAVDLGVILRGIPPPRSQTVREFVFFSYSVRMMDAKSGGNAFDTEWLLNVGFGAVVRLGEGTRLLIQAGPAFDWDMDYPTMPVSLMVQFGSP